MAPASDEQNPLLPSNPQSNINIEQDSVENAQDEEPVSIDPKELIGRRLFNDNLRGTGKDATLRWQTFYDKRFQDGLSLDRLGIIDPNKDQVKHATEIARKDAFKNGDVFHGWASIRASKLMDRKHRIIPTPIHTGDNPNPYHCDLDRSNHASIQAAQSLAYELHAHFSESLRLIAPDPKNLEKEPLQKSS